MHVAPSTVKHASNTCNEFVRSLRVCMNLNPLPHQSGASTDTQMDNDSTTLSLPQRTYCKTKTTSLPIGMKLHLHPFAVSACRFHRGFHLAPSETSAISFYIFCGLSIGKFLEPWLSLQECCIARVLRQASWSLRRSLLKLHWLFCQRCNASDDCENLLHCSSSRLCDD